MSGLAFIEFKLAASSDARWNVHIHAVAVLASTTLPSSSALEENWRTLLAREGVEGSAHVARVKRRGVPSRKGGGRA